MLKDLKNKAIALGMSVMVLAVGTLGVAGVTSQSPSDGEGIVDTLVSIVAPAEVHAAEATNLFETGSGAVVKTQLLAAGDDVVDMAVDGGYTITLFGIELATIHIIWIIFAIVLLVFRKAAWRMFRRLLGFGK